MESIERRGSARPAAGFAACERSGSGWARRAGANPVLGLIVVLLAVCTMSVPARTQQIDAEEPIVEEEVAEESVALEEPRVVAQFTTGVENREPIDHVTFVENDARKVFFFTELHGLEGETIRHRWLYGGEVRAEVSFEVRGPRWRVWSSKELLPDWIGDWTVEIVLSDGEVIAAESFTYSAPQT